MKVIKEEYLKDIWFGNYASKRIAVLTDNQINTLDNIIEDIYPNGITMNNLSDLLWEEADKIARWLGFDSFEQLENNNQNKRRI